MLGSYVLRTKAAFSAADQRWSRGISSIVSVCLVIRTVLCLLEDKRWTHSGDSGGYRNLFIPSATESPFSVTCMTASLLNSGVNRCALMECLLCSKGLTRYVYLPRGTLMKEI